MTITAVAPTSNGTSQWSYTGAASEWQSVASNDADTSYVYTAAAAYSDFAFSGQTPNSGLMVMGVRLVATARVTTGSATLKLTSALSSGLRHDLPRDSSFTLTDTYADYSITLCNRPFQHFMSRDNAWLESDGTIGLNDFEFGCRVDSISGGGQVRVTQFRVDVITRATITLDTLLTSEQADIFQWVEIEGIPYVVTDRTTLNSDWTVGAYYFGPEYRVVPGALSTAREFRSGSINYKSGREEFETAKVTLLDVTETAHECDANSGDPELVIKQQGFFSWLLAYGDRTNITADYMLDSSTYNTNEGLDPKYTGSYGRRFVTTNNPATKGFAAAGTETSYVYVDKETLWYGELQTDGFGDESDADDLVRGRFGSMDSGHKPNLHSGVYPLVTDHPTTWNGRWVRWWINAFDKETGLPFPMSLAQARTYLWGTHAQVIGPSKNQYEVRLSPFEDALKATSPGTSPATVKGLNISAFEMKILYDVGATAYKTAKVVISSDRWYESVQKMFSDATPTTGFQALVQAAITGLAVGVIHIDFSVAGNLVKIQATGNGKIYLGFNGEAGAILGFPSGQQLDPSPDPGDTFTDPVANTEQQNWLGEKPPAQSFVSGRTKTIYVEDNHTDDWNINYTTVAYFKVVSGDSVEHFRIRDIAVQNDSDGDHLHVWAARPTPIMGITTKKPRTMVYSTGDKAIKVTIGINFAPTESTSTHLPFLQLMMSTGFGHNDPAGTSYDALPEDCGLAMDYRLIDWEAFEYVGSLLKSPRSYILDEPTRIEDLMKGELAWPNGIILRQNASGQLQWTMSLIPSTSESAPTILMENWVKGQAVRQEHSSRNLINEIVADIDYDAMEGKFFQTLDAREPNSVASHGKKSLKVRNYGIKTYILGTGAFSSNQPHSKFKDLCHSFFSRFGFELPELSGSINQRGLALLPGDGVRVTHDELQDPRDNTATGFSARPCEVMSIKKDDLSGLCTVKLLHDGTSKKHGGYAPAAVVESWDGGSDTATCYANRINTGTGDAADASHFEATDVCSIYEGNEAAPDEDEVTISAVSGNDITFSATPSFTPADGDVIVWADYGSCTDDQVEEAYVHIGIDSETTTIETDPFDGASVDGDWTQSAGNGTIVQTGGALELRCPNATVCYFDATYKNRPMVTRSLSGVQTNADALYCAETEMTIRYAVNGYSAVVIALMEDEENYRGVSGGPLGNHTRWAVNNVHTLNSGYGTPAGLHTRRFRVYWVPAASSSSYTAEGTETVDPGEISSWYSEDGGTTYTKLETTTLANSPDYLALWANNSSIIYEDIDGVFSYYTLLRYTPTEGWVYA